MKSENFPIICAIWLNLWLVQHFWQNLGACYKDQERGCKGRWRSFMEVVVNTETEGKLTCTSVAVSLCHVPLTLCAFALHHLSCLEFLCCFLGRQTQPRAADHLLWKSSTQAGLPAAAAGFIELWLTLGLGHLKPTSFFIFLFYHRFGLIYEYLKWFYRILKLTSKVANGGPVPPTVSTVPVWIPSLMATWIVWVISSLDFKTQKEEPEMMQFGILFLLLIVSP